MNTTLRTRDVLIGIAIGAALSVMALIAVIRGDPDESANRHRRYFAESACDAMLPHIKAAEADGHATSSVPELLRVVDSAAAESIRKEFTKPPGAGENDFEHMFAAGDVRWKRQAEGWAVSFRWAGGALVMKFNSDLQTISHEFVDRDQVAAEFEHDSH